MSKCKYARRLEERVTFIEDIDIMCQGFKKLNTGSQYNYCRKHRFEHDVF